MDKSSKRTAIYRAWGQLVLRAWGNEDFKRALIADPKKHLSELGVQFPDDIQISVVAETENNFALHLPNKPENIQTSLSSGDVTSVGGMPLMSSFGVCDDMVDRIKG